jgi:hypothetical protein
VAARSDNYQLCKLSKKADLKYCRLALIRGNQARIFAAHLWVQYRAFWLFCSFDFLLFSLFSVWLPGIPQRCRQGRKEATSPGFARAFRSCGSAARTLATSDNSPHMGFTLVGFPLLVVSIALVGFILFDLVGLALMLAFFLEGLSP